MLSTELIIRPFRKAIAKAVAYVRLKRLLRHAGNVERQVFINLVDSLSETMCETGIFRPRRIRNFKRQFCEHCVYRMYSKNGYWCYMGDCYLTAVKNTYCGWFTEKKR